MTEHSLTRQPNQDTFSGTPIYMDPEQFSFTDVIVYQTTIIDVADHKMKRKPFESKEPLLSTQPWKKKNYMTMTEPTTDYRTVTHSTTESHGSTGFIASNAPKGIVCWYLLFSNGTLLVGRVLHFLVGRVVLGCYVILFCASSWRLGSDSENQWLGFSDRTWRRPSDGIRWLLERYDRSTPLRARKLKKSLRYYYIA